MDSFIFPPTPLDSTDLTVTVVLAIVIVTMGLGNKLNIPLMGRSQGMMTYSKFAQEAGQIVPSFNVPSRLGMFLLYAPSVIVAFFTPTSTPRAILVMQLMVVHFGKRSLECLFLHRYSGTMPILSSVNILVAYAGFSWMNIYYAGLTPPLQTIDSVYPGLALFAVGELGNLYVARAKRAHVHVISNMLPRLYAERQENRRRASFHSRRAALSARHALNDWP